MSMMDHQLFTLQINEEEVGRRVDQLLANYLTDLSRSKIKRLIQNGKLYVNKKLIYEGDYKVKLGECIELYREMEPTPSSLAPQQMLLQIVYEDDYLLVIDKPAGLVVHPGAGNHNDTLANGLVYYLADNISNLSGTRPGIVHRLDKDTSGLLVVAKQDIVHAKLTAQMAKRAIKREYFALVYGVPYPRAGTIETYIGRSQHDRKKMMVQQDKGKLAITNYKVEHVYSDVIAAITCILQTGRTHQIRVHMTHQRHPIVGDQTYGRSYNHNLKTLPVLAQQLIKDLKRQALHAQRLGFNHPVSGQWLEFNSTIPVDIQRIVMALAG